MLGNRADGHNDVWFSAAGRSWGGRHRDNNEDSLLVSPVALAVADGVGGHEAGELASALVIEKLAASWLSQRHINDPDELRRLLAMANAEIGVRLYRDSRLLGMATTLTALFAGRDRVLLAQLGDSRAYRLRDGVLSQMSRDDSLIQELIDGNLLSVEQAASHPFRSIVLRVFGGQEDDAAHVTITAHDVAEDDRWLLASDGLTDYVPIETIAAVMRETGPPDRLAGRLIDIAERGDSRDNVSVVVCDLVATPIDGAVEVFGSAHDLFGLTSLEA